MSNAKMFGALQRARESAVETTKMQLNLKILELELDLANEKEQRELAESYVSARPMFRVVMICFE